ncbi:ribose import ATP-binding protein RbsA 2 [Streptomyces azureus]|uniref:Ribose import ATP-binding protein RbsA 2 n=1 Tax=Streptomyces azureus TaxID=146537 RepID=A0A0K8PYH6_STRAJ|nr:ribose import ATP-binding protein RbsA 2 [Streptomyces azureus]
MSARIASRIELREMPSWTARSRSVGSRWPGSSRPSPITAFTGLHIPTRGTVRADGAALPFGDVQAAPKAGVGFVPRDRHDEGLVFGMSIGDNASATRRPAGPSPP